MCAGCSGGRPVSSTTARLNADRLKPAVQQALQRRVGRRARISVFGDRWVLRLPTGRQEVFEDVEALAAALTAQGLAGPADPPGEVPAGPSGEAHGNAAAELVSALLAGPP